jgi:hypothetical protein
MNLKKTRSCHAYRHAKKNGTGWLKENARGQGKTMEHS